MQTGIWMSYSDCTHFSDKLSYKILFISSYGLEVINFARLTYLQELFFRKTEKRWNSSHRGSCQPGSLTGGADAMTWRADWDAAAEVAPSQADDRDPPVR
jgi:hypothetical protein